MAFLRFSRDKRGVENFYLVQPTTNRRGKVRPRVLYWFRSPPDVKVGREPFDPALRRALEAQNPDVDFDWRAIVDTPIPSADADKWRERRRAERAAKHAAAEEASVEAESSEPDTAGDAELPQDSPAASPETATVARSAQPSQGLERSGDGNRRRRGRRRSGGGRDNRPSGSPPPPNPESSGD